MSGKLPREARAGTCIAGLVLAMSGCGSHANDEIPDGLLDAIAEGTEGEAGDYPEGTRGGRVGDIAVNVCVEGWRNPQAARYDPDQTESICFADYWDPSGEDGLLLLVNTGAIWCTACRVEYGGTNTRPSLAEEVRARFAAGLRILGTLFQDDSRDPASIENGIAWARAFDVDFPFGIDPGFEMGAFADPLVQPFNLVIDTRTMEVVLRVPGDNPAQLWPAIDELLESER